jgi:hypothetical protein
VIHPKDRQIPVVITGQCRQGLTIHSPPTDDPDREIAEIGEYLACQVVGSGSDAVVWEMDRIAAIVTAVGNSDTKVTIFPYPRTR